MEKQPLFWLTLFSSDGKDISPTFFFPLVYSNVCQYNEALPASDLTQTCKEKVRVQCGSAVEQHQSH